MTNKTFGRAGPAITSAPAASAPLFQDAFKQGLGATIGALAGAMIWISAQSLPVLKPYQLDVVRSDIASQAKPEPATAPKQPETATVAKVQTPAVPPQVHSDHPVVTPKVEISPAAAPSVTAMAPPPTPEKPKAPVPVTRPPLPWSEFSETKEPYGILPIVRVSDKKRPFDAYRAAYDPQILTKPLVVIVMADFGLSSKGSQDLLEKLPAAVTLSVPPAAPNTKILAQSAFNHGHELWTQAVTEPMDYPSSDPGHHALLTASSIEKNEKSLFNQMATLPGAVGFLATTPSPYFKSAADADFVAGAMFKRGLALMINSDQVASILSSEARKQGAAFYSGSMITLAPGENTDTFLQAVERRAVDDGYGIVICPANRVLQERVLSWASGLKTKGIEIAPLSVIAERGLTLMGAP